MNTPAAIELTGTFVKYVGVCLAELKRADLATVDLDLLMLNRNVLTERLQELEVKIKETVVSDKANMIADLSSRSLGNNTITSSFELAIERDANAQLAVAWREHNRAIEEIAILERRVNALNVPLRRRLWNSLCKWPK